MKVIVTGGSRGIGKAIVENLVAQGDEVVFNYNASSGPADELVKELTAKGGKVWAFQADVSSFEAAANLVEQAKEVFGGSIDGVVNNAGITNDQTFAMMD